MAAEVEGKERKMGGWVERGLDAKDNCRPVY
jgi:hypothetical protein